MSRTPAEIAKENTARLLKAFRAAKVAESDLWGSTGYGLDDVGRSKLEAVYSSYFGAEAALVRPQIVSGTHAAYLIARALNLGTATTVFCPFRPYESVFHNIAPLLGQTVVWDGTGTTRGDYLWLQRSGGYTWNQGLNIAELAGVIHTFKSNNPDGLVIVDNCYGEFVEEVEPTSVGADLVFGSLIKNPGGTVTLTGGYVVGRADLVAKVAEALYGPALGSEQGSTGSFVREALQGFFLGQLLTFNAILGKLLLLEQLANTLKERTPFADLIVRTRWSDRETQLAAARVVQRMGPINSHVTPEPFFMAGYENPIVMAWTGFVQGESLSLSADAEVAEPYMLFIQPGVNVFVVELLATELKQLVHMC